MTMVASVGLSCVLSSLISLLLMAGMQIFRHYLISTQLTTIFAGLLGSWIFVLTLTSISNFEMHIFGKQFQSKYLEVIISLLIAMFTAGLVHRVAVTTCLLFSIGSLYFLHRISSRKYQSSVPVQSGKNMPTTGKSVNAKKRK